MNHLSKKLCIAVIGAMVVFAGCTKKPKRPSPDQTMLGQGGVPGGGLNAADAGDLGIPGTGLEQRGEGVLEDENTIRNLLQPVYFDLDKSAIRAEERTKLQAAKDYLTQNPQYRLLLEGRCDWRGTAEYNVGLGDRRAAAARTYLQTIGVGNDKVETISKGDLEAVENASDDQMAKDRRVDLVILKK